MTSSSLLHPRASDRQPWLMPAMSSPFKSAHGVDGKLALYPWRNIFVRQGAEKNGDGSRVAPLNDIRRIFEDDMLECVCQSLCCDYITVFVDGVVTPPQPDEDEKKDKSSFKGVAIDGQGRNYGGHLRIAPWGSRLVIEASHEFVLSGELPKKKVLLSGVKNVSGVVFEDVDIMLDMKGSYITYEEGGDEPQEEAPGLQIDAKLLCADGLNGCFFPGSTVTATATVDIRVGATFIIYRAALGDGDGDGGGGLGWGGGRGGWGGGGGGGGGGPGWSEHGPNIPGGGTTGDDDDDDDDDDDGEDGWSMGGGVNVRCLMRGFVRCYGADVSGVRSQLTADIKTAVGAEVDIAGVASSSQLYGREFVARCESRILVEGGGRGYEKYDENGRIVETGVESFALQGRSNVSGVLGSPGGDLQGALCDVISEAIAVNLNVPIMRNLLTGETRTGPIGGNCKAEAYGFRACNRALFSRADGSCEATARHPNSWGYIACPYSGNREADYTGATGTHAYCRSNHVDFCGNVEACYDPNAG